jgi:hypothetical protein
VGEFRLFTAWAEATPNSAAGGVPAFGQFSLPPAIAGLANKPTGVRINPGVSVTT